MLAVVALIASSCGVEKPSSASTIDVDVVGSYFNVWEGDPGLAGVTEYGEIDRDDWDALVKRAADLGLETAAEEDGRLLLAGSIKAYLFSTRDARYTISVPPDGRADLYETYRRQPDGSYSLLATRRETHENTLAQWPGIPRRDEGRGESRLFVDGDLRTTIWSREGTDWTCEIMQGEGAGIRAAADGYIARFVSIANGKIVDIDDAGMIAIQAAGAKVWLDGRTLWPVRFEFSDPETSAVVRIDGRNLSERVEPPEGRSCPAS